MHHLTVERFSPSIFPYARDLAVRLSALKAQVSRTHTEVTPSDLHDISHDRHTQYLFLQYHGGREVQNVVGMLLIVRSPLSQSALLGPIVVDRLGLVRGHGTSLMVYGLQQVWVENHALRRIDLTTVPVRQLVPWYERFGFVVRDTTPMRLERPASAACP